MNSNQKEILEFQSISGQHKNGWYNSHSDKYTRYLYLVKLSLACQGYKSSCSLYWKKKVLVKIKCIPNLVIVLLVFNSHTFYNLLVLVSNESFALTGRDQVETTRSAMHDGIHDEQPRQLSSAGLDLGQYLHIGTNNAAVDYGEFIRVDGHGMTYTE